MFKPILHHLRSKGFTLVIYLDDILLINENKHVLLQQINYVSHLLKYLGFIINNEKSELNPKQCITFLGFKFESRNMTMSVPLEKSRKIIKDLQCVQKKSIIKIRHFAGYISVGVSCYSLWLGTHKKF